MSASGQDAPAEEFDDEVLPFRPIDPYFPKRAYEGDIAAVRADGEFWRKGRAWAGYPELEWTHPLTARRVLAFERFIPAYFYETVSSFETARLAVMLNAVLEPAHVRACPHLDIGFRYFDSAYYTVDGRLPMPTADDPYRGQHSAIAIYSEHSDEIGFVGWRQDWGNKGYGYISREYFEPNVVSLVVSWSAMGGPSRAFHECLRKAVERESPRFEQLTHCWPAQNEFQEGEEEINGTPHTVLYWEVYSLEDNIPVDVFEIRRDEQVIGRAHIYHEDGKSSLRELVVEPESRRFGYGAHLESMAMARAQHYKSRTLELWLHDDDARPRRRGAAEAFGLALGYEWQMVDRTRPIIVAIGSKEI
jgi:GNAT superfamily N-acetyltransferase